MWTPAERTEILAYLAARTQEGSGCRLWAKDAKPATFKNVRYKPQLLLWFALHERDTMQLCIDVRSVCENPLCMTPEHLYLCYFDESVAEGRPRENVRPFDADGRKALLRSAVETNTAHLLFTKPITLERLYGISENPEALREWHRTSASVEDARLLLEGRGHAAMRPVVPGPQLQAAHRARKAAGVKAE